MAPLNISDGSISTDPSTKAKLLSAYFSSVFHVDNGTLPQPPLTLSNINVNPNFSTANVLKLLNKFDPCSAGDLMEYTLFF